MKNGKRWTRESDNTQGIRMHNVLFPVWFLFYLYPIAWYGACLWIDYVVDALVFFVGLRILKIHLKARQWIWVSLKIWIIGFVCDFIAAVGVFVLSEYWSASGSGSYDSIYNALLLNPFRNGWAVCIMLAAIAFAGLLIWILNEKISFAKLPAQSGQKRKLALILACCTAPYLFLFPTRLL